MTLFFITPAPTFLEKIPARGNDVFDNKVLPVFRHRCKGIPCKQESHISGIEVTDIAGTPRRDMVKDLLGRIAVGVEEPDAIAAGNHLYQDVAEQVCLS